MEIYWNILIWSSFVALSWYIFPARVVLVNGVYEKRANLTSCLLSFSIILVFAGLRSGIADTWAYIHSFNNLSLDYLNDVFTNNTKDKGFDLFTYFIKFYISGDFHVWLFIIALISCLAIMIPLYKHSTMFELSTFLFVASAQFTWLLNGMRQFIAISILFLSIDLILKKRFIAYLITVLLLSTIHGSAIFMLPFGFLCQSRPWSKNSLLVILLSLAAFLSIDKVLPFSEFFLEGTQYEGYSALVSSLEGSNVYRLIVAAVPLLLTIWKIREVNHLNDRLLNICINMSTYNFCIMLLSTGIGGIFLGRLATYFDIYNLLLYPLILTKLFDKQARVILYAGIILCYTVLFYYQMDVTWNLEYVSDVLGFNQYSF